MAASETGSGKAMGPVRYDRGEPDRTGWRDRASVGASSLPATADASLGTTNLATIARAGNISTDTRAGG